MGEAIESRLGEEQETENLIETYRMIAEWIRFADAKSAVVLTVAGALTGFIVPTIKEYLQDQPSTLMKYGALALFAVWLILLVLSAVRAFLCIMPMRQKGCHPARDLCTHFHPAAVSHHYTLAEVDRFMADYQKLGTGGFKREIIASVLIDAHISSRKYAHVSAAIKLFGLSSLFAFAYLITIQF